MAKNLGRQYATMSEDERGKFALEEEEGSRELPAELAFDEPRKRKAATSGKCVEDEETIESGMDDV